MIDTPPSRDSLERCTELWFSDCGLIIRAETMLFRLSGQMLSAHSPVFADMLAFPQPEEDDSEQLEGCPVVSLPDSADHLRSFFRALFDYEYFKPYPAETEFPVIEGVLRLSQKELSALWMLPMVFYWACRALNEREILSGQSNDGGVVSFPPAEQVILISGNLALRTWVFTNFLKFLYPSAIPLCRTPFPCLTWRMETRLRAEQFRNARWTDPMFTSMAIHPPIPDLCPPCSEGLAAGVAVSAQPPTATGGYVL
ncbi:hypothetical protein B0H11DRAFT_2189990, partial [Mycena galericulata]